MVAVIPNPFVFKDATLTIAADSYEAAISKAEIVPSSSSQTFKGASPGASWTDQSYATWVCNLEYAQDWKDPASLSNYLHEHEGEAVDAVFVPKVGTGEPSVAATLVITPGSIGGTVDAFATSSVTLGVSGKPEIIPGA